MSIKNELTDIIIPIIDTVAKKNEDYGDSFTKTVDEFGTVMYAVRLDDKVNRVKSLIKSNSQKVADESLRDTITDIIGYALLTLRDMDNREKSKPDQSDWVAKALGTTKIVNDSNLGRGINECVGEKGEADPELRESPWRLKAPKGNFILKAYIEPQQEEETTEVEVTDMFPSITVGHILAGADKGFQGFPIDGESAAKALRTFIEKGKEL